MNAILHLIGISAEKYFRNILDYQKVSYDRFYVFIDWSRCSKIKHPTKGTFALHRAAMISASFECLKLIYHANPIIICTQDPITGLELFMLAAANNQSKLSAIYFLLREYPQAIINHHDNDTNAHYSDETEYNIHCLDKRKNRRLSEISEFSLNLYYFYSAYVTWHYTHVVNYSYLQL